jgi:hypothetical protein
MISCPACRKHHTTAVRAVVLIYVTVGGCGCSTGFDEAASRLITAPGHYDTYPCQNIQAQIRVVQARHLELQALMARASQSPGGAVAGAMAYRTEYIQAQGQLEELGRAENAKQCRPSSEFASDRAIY